MRRWRDFVDGLAVFAAVVLFGEYDVLEDIEDEEECELGYGCDVCQTNPGRSRI